MRLETQFINLGLDFKANESLKKYSTFRTGGNADYVVFPRNEIQLASLLQVLSDEKIPYMVVGNGSNILFSDNGYKGVLISLRSGFSDISLTDECEITAGGGASLIAVSLFACNNSLAGMEFSYGIPGLIGGAVYMNAGAYGGEISQILVSCRYMEPNGSIVTYTNEDLQLGYRTSALQKKNGILLSAVFRLTKGQKETIRSKMDEFMAARNEKQPLDYPNCGSTFKRPEGHFAGKLIQDCELRGFSIGDAQVSEKHCGFIINKGNATSTEIMELITHVQKIVFDNTGVHLEPEVRIIGF